MAGTIVDGTGLYDGLPVSQYEGTATLNIGTAGADETFWMLWRTFGDCLRATALGYHVANSNTQPTMVLDDIDLTMSLDTWYFVLSNLKPDYRYLDCFDSFVQYVNFYIELYVGNLAREQPLESSSPEEVQDMDEEQYSDDDNDGLTLDAIANAFFDSAPVGDCVQAADEDNYIVVVDRILEPAVRIKYALGTNAPPGPSIGYEADVLNENSQVFRSLEESMPYYEAAARIVPRALAIAAWGEYAIKNLVDVRKTLSYTNLVSDFTAAVANFLYSFDVIGYADDIELRRTTFVPDVPIDLEGAFVGEDVIVIDDDDDDDDGEDEEEEPPERRATRSTGPVRLDGEDAQDVGRMRTKTEKRVMREIETVAIILSRVGDMDTIGSETTTERIAEVVDSSFGVRLQNLITGVAIPREGKAMARNARMQEERINLETAIRDIEQRLANPGSNDDVEELNGDLDGLRNALTDLDQDIANIADELKEEQYLNAYRTNIAIQPRAFLMDLFEQFRRSVLRINTFVVKDFTSDRDDDKAEDTAVIGPARPSEFFLVRVGPNTEYSKSDVLSFRPRMERISERVQRVQTQRLVLGPSTTINDTNASGEKYFQLTRTTGNDFPADPVFVDDAGWVDLFSFLYSTGELFLDWQRKLALEIDIQGRLLTEEFFGLSAKPRASVSVTNAAELAKGNTTVANIAVKIGGKTAVTYKTRIQ